MGWFDDAGLIYPTKPVPPAEKRSHGVKVISARGTPAYPGQPYPKPPGLNIPRDVPAATWTIPHALGRIPNVGVYNADGAKMIAEVYATETQVVVVHAQPATGTVVLT